MRPRRPSEERDLRLKHPEAPILAGNGHLDGLGARITRDAVLPSPRAKAILTARVRAALHTRGGSPLRPLTATVGPRP